MNNFLLLIGVLLVAILAALFAVPHFVDWNSYRGVFEREASRVLGREVQVLGSANLRLLPAPYLRFEKVRISGADGPIAQPLIRADSFTAWLAVAPLLKGTLEAREVAIDRPELRIPVDDSGKGGWAGLADLRLEGAAMPRQLQLNKVKVTNGTLIFLASDGRERTRLNSVETEFSAQSATGPYKAAGKITWRDVDYDFALSTATPDANGNVYVKADLAYPDGKTRYSLEGTAKDLFGTPHLDGSFFAALGSGNKAQRPAKQLPPIEVRASISASPLSAELKDLAVTIDPTAGLQRLEGTMRAEWKEEAHAQLALRSDWLDLDRVLTSGTSHARPMEAVVALASAIGQRLSSSTRIETRLKLGQISLGQQTLGQFRADLVSSGGMLAIERITARLPGGADLFLEGTMRGGANNEQFSGRIALKGTSLMRLASWLAPESPLRALAQDGTFNISGRLEAGPREVALEELSGRALGADLAGAIRYQWSDRRRLIVRLTGSEFDAGGWLPDGIGSTTARRLLGTGKVNAAPASSANAREAVPFDELDLAVALDALIAGGKRYRDLRLDTLVGDGSLAIRSVRLKYAEGAALTLTGDVSTRDGAPHGRVAGSLSAGNREDWKHLADLFGAGPFIEDLGTLIRPEGRGRLAFSVDMGQRAPQSLDIDLDGVLGAGRAMLHAKLDGGLEAWQTSPSEISLAIDDVAMLASRQLAKNLSTAGTPPENEKPALRLFAKGTANRQLAVRVGLSAPGVAIRYRGIARGGAIRGWELDGLAEVASADAATLLAVISLPAPRNLADTRLQGSARIVRHDGQLSLSDIDLVSAAGRWKGQLTVDKTSKVAGELTTAQASMAGLIGLIQIGGETEGQAASSDDTATAPSNDPVWSDKPFDLSIIGNNVGVLRLSADQLTLPGGGSVSKAMTELTFRPSKLDIRLVSGNLAKGRISGSATLEKQGAGISSKGQIDVEDAQLSELAPLDTAGQADIGRVSYAMSFAGSAISPRGLAAIASGTGKLKLTGVRVPGFAPAPMAMALRQSFTAAEELSGGSVASAIRAAMSSSSIVLKDQEVGLSLGEGALRISPVSHQEAGGRLDITTTIDVAGMTLDSEWRFQPDRRLVLGEPEDAVRAALPPVSVVFVGRLSDVGKIEPRVDASTLVRELAVLKMEKGVDELERLRREDEERARLEAERLKAREEAERILRLQEEQRPPEQVTPPSPQPATQPVEQEPAQERSVDVRQVDPAPTPSPPPPAAAARPTPQKQPKWNGQRYFPSINSGG